MVRAETIAFAYKNDCRASAGQGVRHTLGDVPKLALPKSLQHSRWPMHLVRVVELLWPKSASLKRAPLQHSLRLWLWSASLKQLQASRDHVARGHASKQLRPRGHASRGRASNWL